MLGLALPQGGRLAGNGPKDGGTVRARKITSLPFENVFRYFLLFKGYEEEN